MILPLRAKANKVARRQLSLGVGIEATMMGNVAASHASLRI